MTDKAGLTPRDLQVVRLAADGLTDQEIADRLFLTMNTVKYHLKRVYEALEVRNRAQLANSLRGRKDYPNG